MERAGRALIIEGTAYVKTLRLEVAVIYSSTFGMKWKVLGEDIRLEIEAA